MQLLLIIFSLFFSFDVFAKEKLTSPKGTSKNKNSVITDKQKTQPKAEKEIDDSRYYLNTEDEEVVSVFNIPGVNWYTCLEKPGCEAKAWPDNKSKITRTDAYPMTKSVYNPSTGNIEEELFVEINYEYQRLGEDGLMHQQIGRGWIDSAYLSHVKQDPFFKKEVTAEKKDCAPKSTIEASKENLNKSGKAISKILVYQGVFDAVEQLKSVVGMCVKAKPHKAIKTAVKGKRHKNIVTPDETENPYDLHVLPKLIKLGVPRIIKENGETATPQDIIDIDALARTTYAEMAKCYKYGLQYPMAVMKVSLNRSESKHKSQFIRKTHNKAKGSLAKVVTSPSQYSTWLEKIKGKKNLSYSQALCPPSNPKKRFWTGGFPPAMEKSIWKNTLLMAAETVLFPKKFKQRTSAIDVEHYTSGLDIETFYKMHLVTPAVSIGGRKIDRPECLQLWE